MKWRGIGLWTLAVLAACSASNSGGGGGYNDGSSPQNDGSSPNGDGGSTQDGAVPTDGTQPTDSTVPPMDSPAPKDSAPPMGGWDGSFGGGPLTCPGTLSYLMNGDPNACGRLRWDIKTGTDSQAGSISLVPQLTTIANLVGIPNPQPFSSRVSPTETTLYALKDVRLVYVHLESDQDYHMGLTDTGVNTMIAEIPYPDCASGSAWSCLITRARGTFDKVFQLQAGSSGMGVNQVVSLIGVGFFDTEPHAAYAAPNAIEIHPVLALCFGQGCTPGQ